MLYATDFVYDGEYLSDYGFIICSFDSATGANVVSRGSELTFNTMPIANGTKHELNSAKYENCLEITCDICKDPDLCGYDYSDRIISEYEHKKIINWLNRKQFLPLSFESDYDHKCYFDASFNIENIYIGDVLYGFRLTIYTSRPFGYGENIQEEIEILESNSFAVLDINSDELGYIYPTLKIKFNKSGGDIVITNETYSSDLPMKISNCTIGETVIIDCENQMIDTSKPEHDICNDFNFRFLKLGNSYRNNENKIKVSLPCTISITYTPIIKNIN